MNANNSTSLEVPGEGASEDSSNDDYSEQQSDMSEELQMVLNDEIPHDEQESMRREDVRRQYRRRRTIDPLSDVHFEEELQRLAENVGARDLNRSDSDHVIDVGEENVSESGDDEYLNLLLGQDNINRSGDNDGAAEGDNDELLRPARDHGYLPTAQPLYPEEWVPAGRHRLRQQERENRSITSSHSSVPNNDEQSAHIRENSTFYRIPPPPSVDERPSHESLSLIDEDTCLLRHNAIQSPLVVLPILEIDNVILFPGSTLPLRLQDRQWMEYLGNLIADARGLYGAHANEAGGNNQSEVRIGILPRIRRRTRRQPYDSGARTGRWRVDLIRRGVAPSRTARRTAADESGASSSTQDDTPHDDVMQVDEDVAVEATNDSQNLNESSAEDENDDDGFFHAIPSRPRTIQHSDPLLGRIGTIATIIFTHEETANPINVSSDSNQTGRHSSMVWRRQTTELVVTAIGTTRYRIKRSLPGEIKDSLGVPLYEVEEMSDGNVSIPQQLIHRPGDSKHPVLMYVPIDTNESEMEHIVDEAFKENADGDEGDNNLHISTEIQNNSILNLSTRSRIPAIAYKTLWPWQISKQICTSLRETKSLHGIYLALSTAAGIETTYDAGKAYGRVVDNSAFANWLSSNLPLDDNDRLDILEMTHVVQQLLYILEKIQQLNLKSKMLRCKYCGTVIANPSHVFTVGGAEGTTGAYVNEHGVVHQTITVREVDARGIISIGYAETKDSW